MFIARPRGFTVRRVLEAPHDPAERADPLFPVVMRCEKCGRYGSGPRSEMREALREHQSRCPARLTRPDDPQLARILFPRV